MTDILRVLSLFSIRELNVYMKLIFIKNLKNNAICNDIFNYLLSNYESIKPTSKTFLHSFINISVSLNLDEYFVIENVELILKKFKEESFIYNEDDTHFLLIENCLNNNFDYNFRTQLNNVLIAF